MVAGACSLVIAWWRHRPAGSLFHIFAFAAIASIPHQPPLWQCMLAAVLTTVFCLLIGISSRLVRSRRTPWAMPEPARLTPDEKRAARLEAVGYLVAAGLAGTLATVVGQWLGFGHNYWAMVAAVVPLVGRTTRHRVARGIQRIIGTILGLILLAGVLLLNPAPWQTVLVIAVCQFGAEMFIARQYVLAQVFVTPLALSSTLLAAPAAPDSAAAGQDRRDGHRCRRRHRRRGHPRRLAAAAGRDPRAARGRLRRPGEGQEGPTAVRLPAAAVTACGTRTRAATARTAAPAKT